MKADVGCQEGKDRTGAVNMLMQALKQFQDKNKGKLPDTSNSGDVQDIATNMSKIILSGFDAKGAGNNTTGGDGMKNLNAYIPPQIYRALTQKAKDEVKGYKDKTSWFGTHGIQRFCKEATIESDII